MRTILRESLAPHSRPPPPKGPSCWARQLVTLAMCKLCDIACHLFVLQAMALNGSLQVGSALLMLGLTAWTRGWCCNKQQQEGNPDGERRTSELFGGAVLAAGIPEEEPPGTVPDLAVELALIQPGTVCAVRKRASLDDRS